MADIATIWSPALGVGDWAASLVDIDIIVDEDGISITDGRGGVLLGKPAAFGTGQALVSGYDLVTAVLISLFSDAVAADDDVILDNSGDPRGWWGGPIGSKLWLRERSKQTAAVLALVQSDIADALQWLIDDGVASKVDVTTEFVRPGMLGARVVITRGSGSPVNLKFSWAWKDI